MIAEVVLKNISQFREGSLGRFSSQEGGIPVYSRAVRTPDLGFIGGGGGGGGAGVALEEVDMEKVKVRAGSELNSAGGGSCW